MRPIFIPERARARRADWAPGPGVLVPLPVEKIMLVLVYDEMIVNTRRMGKEEQDVPPVARILMWRALIPNSLQRMATSCAANMAAYGEDSSRSALTFIPPVTRVMVSRPDKSAVLELALCAVQIGVRMGRHTDVDEGIVEGSENPGDAKDKLALFIRSIQPPSRHSWSTCLADLGSKLCRG